MEVPIFDDILRSHAIDPGNLSTNNWDGFVKDRREQLRKMIEEVCGGVFQPFSDSIDRITMDIYMDDE